MVTKTALITLVSSLLIAILALTVEKSGTHLGPAPDPASLTGASASWAANGQRGNWDARGAMITGASGSYGGGGQRGNWGTSSITGASGSYGGGGERGDWGEHEGGDDHDGWGGDDD